MIRIISLVIHFAFMSFIYNSGNAIDMYRSLSRNEGYFDFGFTVSYIGVTPHVLENYLFIGEDYWTVERYKNNERVYCINDTESRENTNFDGKFFLAFSYLSDHLTEHANTPTNHVLLLLRLNYAELAPYYKDYNHEVVEVVFSANERGLSEYLGGDYYMYPLNHFNVSVAFRPKSFDISSETNSSNFVFIEQNPTVNGFKRKSEIHSLVVIGFQNKTEELKGYIPPFIASIDPHLYINAIFPTSLAENSDINGAVLILNDKGITKYCVTEESNLDSGCEPSNLRQLTKCSISSHDEEL